MSSETHINALKVEVEQAFKNAHDEIDKAKAKLDTYLQRFVAENPVETNTEEESTFAHPPTPSYLKNKK